MNKVFLIGNLTRDPELSERLTELRFAALRYGIERLHEQRRHKRKRFFQYNGLRGRAEVCGKYLKKAIKWVFRAVFRFVPTKIRKESKERG
jgi:single-stranded DNA-binding protein